MALNKITYTNKETINPQPSVADINKVTANDMNEIKSVVNGACTQVDTNTSDIATINEDLIDTGWVDMSGYINTTYFAARPGQTPMVRKIGKICYWKGAVYCTTAVGANQAYLFTNLPSTYSPPYEHAGCGVHFPSDDTYIIFLDGSGGIVVNEGSNWIQPTLEYEGYALGNLGNYPID